MEQAESSVWNSTSSSTHPLAGKAVAASAADHPVGRLLIILLRRQDLWTFSRDGDRMLVLGGKLTVQRPRGPAVRIDCHVIGAFGDHGLDREHHAFLDAGAFAGIADMHISRLLVQVTTDAMGEKVAHDAEAVRLRMPLDRACHVTEPIAGLRLRDAEVKAFLRDAHQLLGLRRDLPDRIAPGRIAEPAVELRNRVDRHDIAFLKWLIARKSMRDHVVDGGARRIWIALVALLVWLGAMLQNNVLEYAINLVRRDARFDERGDRAMAFGHHLACLADGLNFMLAF